MENKVTVRNPITEGCIWKGMLLFALPIMLGSLLQQLYNTADAVIVGRFVGKEALAAVEPPETWISDFLSRKIQDPEDPAQIKKASDALVRRGFSWHTASQAVTRFLNGTDPW